MNMHLMLKVSEENAEYVALIADVTGGYEGVRYVFKFPNGFGASVIKTCSAYFGGSYGHEDDKWELAVLEGDEITYATDITHDVLGWLSDEEVDDTLTRIRELSNEPVFEGFCDWQYTPEEYDTYIKLRTVFLQQDAKEAIEEYCADHNCAGITFNLYDIVGDFMMREETQQRIWEDVIEMYIERRKK